MRNLLRRLGARTGISLGLVIVIATVLVVARLAGERSTEPTYRGPQVTLPSVGATEGDDGEVATEPTTYADDEAVRSAARDFAAAWLQRTKPAAQWLDGMRPHATADLIDRLAGVDPLNVPSGATLGPVQLRSRTDLFAEVAIPIATGEALVLGLAHQSGRWLVATVDQEIG